MIDCVICDLDGTLANNKHRQHHMSGAKKDWGKFFAAMSQDTVFGEILFLLWCIRMGSSARIILATGRPVQYLGETSEWLQHNRVPHDKLIMRKRDDNRSDAVAKHDMLTTLRAMNYNPILSIDDRPEVVDMWRRNNVPCIQADATDWAIRDRGDHNGDPLKFLRIMAAVPGSDPMYRVAIDELERARGK